jgi:hypothetical protein
MQVPDRVASGHGALDPHSLLEALCELCNRKQDTADPFDSQQQYSSQQLAANYARGRYERLFFATAAAAAAAAAVTVAATTTTTTTPTVSIAASVTTSCS